MDKPSEHDLATPIDRTRNSRKKRDLVALGDTSIVLGLWALKPERTCVAGLTLRVLGHAT